MTALSRRHLLVIIAMVLAVTTLAMLLAPLRRAQGFHVPDAAEAAAAQAMFGNALRQGGVNEAGLAREASQFGLSAGRLEFPEGLSLAETADDCAGRGAYLLRRGEGLIPVALVAPHRGADRETGPIAQQLFAESRFAAAAWNSAPRRPQRDCPHAGDVARAPTHYITAFSLAFAARYPGGRVVQLHGFERNLRSDAAARQADAIISNGSDVPSDRLLDFADCLTTAFPERRILVYPIETGELGALENAQGRALRAAGYQGFTHLELSAEFRAQLVVDPQLRARLAACLGARL